MHKFVGVLDNRLWWVKNHKILDVIDIKLIDVKKSTSSRRLPEFWMKTVILWRDSDENKLFTKTKLRLVHL